MTAASLDRLGLLLPAPRPLAFLSSTTNSAILSRHSAPLPVSGPISTTTAATTIPPVPVVPLRRGTTATSPRAVPHILLPLPTVLLILLILLIRPLVLMLRRHTAPLLLLVLLMLLSVPRTLSHLLLL